MRWMKRMKERWRLGVATAFGICLGLSAGSLRSQDRGAVVPGMRILLENARVRVQYHDVAVGETVPMHSHPAYVAYVLKPYKARLRLADGSQKLADTAIHNLIVELKDGRDR